VFSKNEINEYLRLWKLHKWIVYVEDGQKSNDRNLMQYSQSPSTYKRNLLTNGHATTSYETMRRKLIIK